MTNLSEICLPTAISFESTARGVPLRPSWYQKTKSPWATQQWKPRHPRSIHLLMVPARHGQTDKWQCL